VVRTGESDEAINRVRFGRLAPMQASSLARLPTLRALFLAGRAFLGTLTDLWRLGVECPFLADQRLARVTLGHDCGGFMLRAFAHAVATLSNCAVAWPAGLGPPPMRPVKGNMVKTDPKRLLPCGPLRAFRPADRERLDLL
jgi:hypothetical protein